jgi:hypothetical protein
VREFVEYDDCAVNLTDKRYFAKKSGRTNIRKSNVQGIETHQTREFASTFGKAINEQTSRGKPRSARGYGK